MNQFCISPIHTITIYSPSVTNLFRIRLALDTLRYKSYKDYLKVIRSIRSIFVISVDGYANAIYPEHRLWVIEGSLLEDSTYDSYYLASLLLHEAHHVTQYLKRTPLTNQGLETGAYRVQLRFLKHIGDTQSLEWLKKQYQQKWWEAFYTNDKVLKKFEKHLRLYLKWGCEAQTVPSR